MTLSILRNRPAASFLNPFAIIDHHKRFGRIVGKQDFRIALGSFAKPEVIRRHTASFSIESPHRMRLISPCSR